MNNLDEADAELLEAAQGWSELGAYQDSLLALGRVSEANQGHPRILYQHVVIHANTGQLAVAMSHARRLIEIAPEWFASWLGRALVLDALGRPGEAYHAFRPTLHLFPDQTPSVLRYIARLVLRAGWMDEAKFWLRQAFKLDKERTLRVELLECRAFKPLWAWMRETRESPAETTAEPPSRRFRISHDDNPTEEKTHAEPRETRRSYRRR